MYGWRGKLGFVNPAISDTSLLEYFCVLPEGVLITSVGLKVENLVDKVFQEIIGKIEEAVKVLGYEEVQARIVGGAPSITKMAFLGNSR